jgi:hypothetical protein
MKEPKMNELERILTNDEELQPMTGFSRRVMRAVREEATAPAPIAFPWARFLPGFLFNLALLLGATVWVILQPGNPAPAQIVPAEWFSDPQARQLLWAALTVIGTGALAWTASRWFAPRREMSF